MPKSKKAEKSKFKFRSTQRFQRPDPRFNCMVVTKFINLLMRDGKKSVARKVFYDSMDLLAKKVPDNEPLETFRTAINNVMPLLEVRSRRVGGATYQVPMEVTPKARSSPSRFARSWRQFEVGAVSRWRNDSPMSLRQLSVRKAPRSLGERIRTRWRRRTSSSLTTPGRNEEIALPCSARVFCRFRVLHWG